MSDPFPVFDNTTGRLMGNLTISQGQAPVPDFAAAFDAFNPLPAISSGFAPATATGPKVVSQGSGAGSGGAVSTTSQSTAAPSTNAQPTAGASPAAGLTSGSVADYFLRGVIIVLGFIFVAIGLNMFRPGIVPNPARIVGR
jgi:hypothetical protein